MAISRIKNDFMESDIRYKVDILDYHALSENFRKIIDARHEIIYEGEGDNDYTKRA